MIKKHGLSWRARFPKTTKPSKKHLSQASSALKPYRNIPTVLLGGDVPKCNLHFWGRKHAFSSQKCNLHFWRLPAENVKLHFLSGAVFLAYLNITYIFGMELGKCKTRPGRSWISFCFYHPYINSIRFKWAQNTSKYFNHLHHSSPPK